MNLKVHKQIFFQGSTAALESAVIPQPHSARPASRTGHVDSLVATQPGTAILECILTARSWHRWQRLALASRSNMQTQTSHVGS